MEIFGENWEMEEKAKIKMKMKSNKQWVDGALLVKIAIIASMHANHHWIKTWRGLVLGKNIHELKRNENKNNRKYEWIQFSNAFEMQLEMKFKTIQKQKQKETQAEAEAESNK